MVKKSNESIALSTTGETYRKCNKLLNIKEKKVLTSCHQVN